MMKNKKRTESGELAWPTVQRLSEYLIILEQCLDSGKEVISSSELAEIYSNTPSQVRQDIFRLPNTGRVGQGYNARELVETIRVVLGLDIKTKIAIVGCGRMGMALARHLPFDQHGMALAALFDSDSSIVGKEVEGVKVMDSEELESVIREFDIKMVALCVPVPVAQSVTDRLVKAGIKGVLNFTKQRLKVPSGIFVQHEQIICSFMQLSYKCRKG
jgi:redox-sensing transcriptional repressor